MAYKEGIRSFTYRIDKKKAGEYLEGLLIEYLDPYCRWWLPFDEIFKILKPPERLLQEDNRYENERSLWTGLREAYEELDDPLILLAKPEIPSDALDRARKRFGIFFEYERQ